MTSLRLVIVDRNGGGGAQPPHVDEASAAIETLQPDVAIVDEEPGTDVGELVRRLHDRYPRLPVVVVTAAHDRIAGQAVRTAGAQALVARGSSVGELVDTVRRLASGVTAGGAGGEVTGAQPSVPPPLDRLTRRELDIMHELVSGHDPATIASRLHLSVNTVRTHVKNILAKLDAHTTLEAVVLAVRAGMAPEGDDPRRR